LGPSSELTKRVVVGVLGAPVVVAIMVAGGASLAALLAVVSAVAAWEFYRIARAGGQRPMGDAGVVLAGLLPLGVHAHFLGLWTPPLTLLALLVIGLLAAAIWTRGVGGQPLGAAAVTLFGVLYTGGTLSYGYALRYHHYAFADATLPWGGLVVPAGGLLLLLPLLVTWASDIGAYAVGRTMGRHKLIPSVSPGKTVEGALGGVVFSVLVAWAYTTLLLQPAAQLGFKWAPWGIIAFGAVVSVAAQLGDLAESLLKREAGVKDSSRILPGHGGVLDRFDSLFFVFPVAFLLIGWGLTWAP
jgi:phosphatidate cytidylyltransferase